MLAGRKEGKVALCLASSKLVPCQANQTAAQKGPWKEELITLKYQHHDLSVLVPVVPAPGPQA